MQITIPRLDALGMEKVAHHVSRHLRPGDIVLLAGPLGVGKTHLIKALARALGSDDLATSPTFAIANFYTSPRCPVIHIDAYRMHNLAEYKDLGLDDYFPTAIVLVEWGNLVAELYPRALKVDLTFSDRADNARDLLVSFTSERWQALADDLAELRKACVS